MTTEITAPTRTGWTGMLWQDMEPGYRAILRHPFIEGLTTGELDHAAFGRFLAQDSYYIRKYARALAVLASKAPTEEMMHSMLSHAQGAVAAESDLHEGLALQVGLTRGDLQHAVPTPTAAAYADFMLARAHDGSFLEGVATILPCMWIYAEVGQHLVAAGSPDPIYARWIENYASGDYATEVEGVLNLLDVVGVNGGDRENATARELAVIATRYEWMFWDSAYRDESWPVLS